MTEINTLELEPDKGTRRSRRTVATTRPSLFWGFMATFLYRCPYTGQNVQGFIAEEVSDDVDAYESITCLACQRVHLVNPATGRVIGEDDE